MVNLNWKRLRINLGISLALMNCGWLATNTTLAIASDAPDDRSPKTVQSIASREPSVILSEIESLSLLEDSDSNDLESLDESLEQVTSVSQLVDVKPTDWAFQALQSLVERYGCIAGYPDKTFRGNRSLSRYEFAAGLNACLDRIQELLAASTTTLARKEDVETVKKLMEAFAPELATLRGKVDSLDVRTATLEKQQFSATAKLSGTAIFILGDAFGRVASDVNNTTLNYQSRLTFTASFTGTDLLRFTFTSSNSRLFNAGNPVIDNAQGGFGTPQRLFSSFPSAFSDETHLVSNGLSEFINDSKLRNLEISYSFALGQRLSVTIAPGTADPVSLGADPVSLFIEPTNTAFSLFAAANPTLFAIPNAGGIGITYRPVDWLNVSVGYAGQETLGQPGSSANPSPSSGLFSGGYSAYANVVLYAGKLSTGLFYLNTYSPNLAIDTLTGGNAAKVSTGGFSSAENDRVSANHLGLNLIYKFSDRFHLGGWVGYSNARVLGRDFLGATTGNRGDVQVLNYAATLAFPDLGGKGNLGGLVFGVQPKVVGTSNARVATAIGLQDGLRSDRDTGFHIEGFYALRVNDRITLTPGLIWLTAPNHDDRNPDAFVTLLRASFAF
ncbi:MAG: iron uptake porin [Leptolyngbyaceae cyanobacterium bins.302]|nr:iron uptake porin [Leptolyngbyaceae cyanobacterium bins.302]